jgi:predicted enzyme related to lactoylglutathione lyase
MIYFRVSDIDEASAALREGGVELDEPHMVHRTEDHELWMTFLRDPDGNNLALMQERPLVQREG